MKIAHFYVETRFTEAGWSEWKKVWLPTLKAAREYARARSEEDAYHTWTLVGFDGVDVKDVKPELGVIK